MKADLIKSIKVEIDFLESDLAKSEFSSDFLESWLESWKECLKDVKSF